MPSTIEERILEMRFNNSNFEKNANQSINTLDRLDKQLQLKEGTTGLGAVESLLEIVSSKFSVLGTVGDQVIRRITDSVLNLANQVPKLIKSLSVDQITAGWDKYGEKTSAVQTIMAATAKDWTDTGKQMEFVNGQLEKLNWFTDETSYNFLDMVNNIGKFTSNNIKLEDAVVAMEGISTWAAISGANVGEAGRAMYNLSQAIAVGSVKLMDWKSIENANMATREFKETALETAVELGTLTKTADGMYKTLQNHVFTAEQFNTQLSDGWFSSKVLLKTLDQYGAFANKLQEVSDETDYTATELLLAIKKYKSTGEVIPELKGKIEELAKVEYDLGLRAFSAAQEAKTFSEAISSVKDAVSTGWMNTFETIFGNYEEAKSLWTDLANGMYEVFAEGGNDRNRMLKEWRHFVVEGKGAVQDYYDETGRIAQQGSNIVIDGRQVLMDSFYSLGSTIMAILDTIKESFYGIFPKITAKNLINLTIQFNKFIESLKPSEATLTKLGNILEGVFATIDIGRMFIVSLYNVIKTKLGPAFKSVGGDIFNTASNIGEWLVNLRDSIKENNTFSKSLNDITSFLKPIVDWLKKAKDAVYDFFEENLKLEKISGIWNKIGELMEKVGKKIHDAVDKIKQSFSEVFTGNGLGSDFIKAIGGLLAGFLGFKAISNIGDGPLSGLLETLKKGLGDILDGLSGTLEKVGGALEGFTNKVNSEALRNIAIAIGILAASVVVLASVDSNKLGASMLVLTGAIGELLLSLKLLNGADGKMKSAAITGLIKLAAAVLVLSIALKTVADLDLASIGRGLLSIAGIMAELLIFLEVMNLLKIKSTTITGVISMAIAIGILAGAIYIFSKMDPNTIGQGFLYMAGTLAVLTASLVILGSLASGGKMLAAGLAMIEMALAITVMAGAIALFGMIPTDKLITGFIAFLAVLLFSVTALTVLSAMSVQVIIAASALLVLSVAIVALAAAVVIFSIIPFDNLVQGIGAMVVVLAAMVVALVAVTALGPTVIAAAAAMLIFSAAIVIAAAGLLVLSVALSALNTIGAVNIIGIAGALAVLGLSLVVLGAGCLVMTLGTIGAAALLALGLALNMIAGLDLLWIALGFTALGAAMIVLAVGGVALGVAAAGLVLGSVALAALGLAMYPLALGLHQLDNVDQQTILKFLEVLAISVAALAGLGAIAEAFAAGFAVLGAACLAAGAGIMLAGEGIALIVDSILKIPDDATKKLKNMAKAMADVLLDHGKEATNALEKVMKDLVKKVDETKAPFSKSTKELVRVISDGFEQGASDTKSSISTMMTSCVEIVSASVPQFSNAALEISDAILHGLEYGASNASMAVSNLMSSAANALIGYYYDFYNSGLNMAYGVAQGVYAGIIYPLQAISYMGNSMVTRFNQMNLIHSPSGLYSRQASFIPKGVAKGIEDNTDYAEDAITDMGQTMVDALSPALAIISGLLDGSIDINPTIRPVVDMSDVYGRSQEIGKMFSSANVGAYVSAGTIGANATASTEAASKIQNGSSSSPVNNVFNIYTQPGQNVDEIASAVERKLNFALKQRKAAGV